MRNALVATILILSLSVQCASAEVTTLVSRRFSSAESPQRAIFLFESAGTVKKAEGLVLPLRSDELSRTGSVQSKEWVAAAYAPQGWSADEHPVWIIVQLVGEQVRMSLLPPGLNGAIDIISDGASLKQSAQKNKELIASYEAQAKSQEGTLRRLRSDADTVGNLGELSALREEREQLEANRIGLTRDAESLQEALRQIRALPDPQNLSRREVELSKIVTELAQAAQEAESSEIQRRSQGEAEWRRQIENIEAARFDNLDELRAELNRLVKRRQELEEIVGVKSQVDY